MHLLSLSGSRNHDGQTARIINAVCEGFIKAGGGTTESIFLPDLKMERCRQCDLDGWGPCRQTQECVIEDDFANLADKIKAADVLLFANPVYFGDLAESMRTLLERLRRTSSRRGLPPQRMRLSDQQPREMPMMFQQQGTPTVGLCLAGGGGGGAPSCCAILENILQRCGFDVVDMIPVRRQNLEVKLRILEITGEWVATKPTSGEGRPLPM